MEPLTGRTRSPFRPRLSETERRRIGCHIERPAPLAAGPLGPGGYIVILRLPFDGGDPGNPPFVRADVGIAP